MGPLNVTAPTFWGSCRCPNFAGLCSFTSNFSSAVLVAYAQCSLFRPICDRFERQESSQVGHAGRAALACKAQIRFCATPNSPAPNSSVSMSAAQSLTPVRSARQRTWARSRDLAAQSPKRRPQTVWNATTSGSTARFEKEDAILSECDLMGFDLYKSILALAVLARTVLRRSDFSGPSLAMCDRYSPI